MKSLQQFSSCPQLKPHTGCGAFCGILSCSCSWACGVLWHNQGETIPSWLMEKIGTCLQCPSQCQETLGKLLCLLPDLKVTGEQHHSLTLQLTISVPPAQSMVCKDLWAPRAKKLWRKELNRIVKALRRSTCKFLKGSGVRNIGHINVKIGTV